MCYYGSYSQSTEVGKIKITLINPPKFIYEGQRFIYFDYIIENKSHHDLFYNRLSSDLVKHESGILFQTTGTRNKEDVTYDGSVPASQNIKMGYGFYSPYNMWGRVIPNTATFSEISGIDKNSIHSLSMPSYLKVGNYNLHLSALFKTQTIDSLGIDWSIKVLPVTGLNKIDMLAVMNAYLYAVGGGHGDSSIFWLSESKPTLWNFVKNNPKSQYAQEGLAYLLTSNGIGNNEVLYKDLNTIFKIFDLMPEIYIPCTHIRRKCISFSVQFFHEFKKMGLIVDIRDYTDKYLKRLELYNPVVSEKLIQEIEENLHMRDFKNYAQARIENEIKQNK